MIASFSVPSGILAAAYRLDGEAGLAILALDTQTAPKRDPGAVPKREEHNHANKQE